MRRGLMLAGLVVGLAPLLAGIAVAQPKAPRVYSDGNGIVLERDGGRTGLTKSPQDVDPALSPDGRLVFYTRRAAGKRDEQSCAPPPKADELRQVSIDGKDDKLLLSGHPGDPEGQLCDFRNKQFSADGRRLYFVSPGWATSAALHVYDLRTREERYLLPANDFVVLSFCKNEHKDDLAVLSHRYFVFGGSYDWYWLYDAAGKKELGPLGEFSDRADLIKVARDEWCH
jgi:dipeptidyl aminopeptidase/acylaminoacyl peptidase